MKIKSAISCVSVLVLTLSLVSCAPPISPKETVKLYLDELEVFKDPIYKKAASDELKQDPEKAERFKKAGETVKELLWTDSSSMWPEKRKQLLIGIGSIVTHKDYEITNEHFEDNKAFVTVIFGKVMLFGKDLGRLGDRQSKPVTYELIKTRQGWRIKDINSMLARRGM